jgi:shikimate dehydrogenase
MHNKKFISLASSPGKTGQYFYTSFFNYYNIDATYTPYKTSNLKQSVSDAIDDGIDGISITMPFKTSVISLLDNIDESVDLYQSCNTIKIVNRKLYGYNCDIEGVKHVSKQIRLDDRISVLGGGAIGSIFAKYLKLYNCQVFSRRANWVGRIAETDVLINCTPCGTTAQDNLFESLPLGTRLVIDMSMTTKNYLAEQCRISNIQYVSGREFYKQQFLKQFEIYTGIIPQPDVYDRFSEKFYQSI